MSFLLPDLVNPCCIGIGLTCVLDHPSLPAHKAVMQHAGQELTALATNGDASPLLVRVRARGEAPDLKRREDFRIEVVRSSALPPGVVGPPSGQMKSIDKFLSAFRGVNVTCTVAANYRIPVADLPPDGLVRSSSLRIDDDMLSVRQTSSSFAIEGAPVHRIAWQCDPDDDDAPFAIDLETDLEETYSDDLLASLYPLMEFAFIAMILQLDPPDERDGPRAPKRRKKPQGPRKPRKG